MDRDRSQVNLTNADEIPDIADGNFAPKPATPRKKRKPAGQPDTAPAARPAGQPLWVPLGYDNGTHFFFHVASREVVKTTTFASTFLYELAPYEYWIERYPTDKGAIALGLAQSDLICASKAVGPFDIERVKGAGVWMDGGRVVVNTGTKLIVDGVEIEQTALSDSRATYVQTVRSIPRVHANPLTAAEGAAFVATCEKLMWLESSSSALLAGWLALARIAAALPVRPHIWVTGGKGTGKSTLMERIVAPALGDVNAKLYLQGSSTEAGIRQTMRASSIPLIFDEFETTGAGSKDRIAAVVELLRNSWSATEGRIVKGSAAGQSTHYHLAFAALVSSIRVALPNDADRSRFSVLELKPHDAADTRSWAEFEKELGLIDVEFGERLFARSVANVKNIIASHRVVRNHLAATFGNRFGDQIGMLVAGWWSLGHDEVITPREAAEACQRLEFASEVEDAQTSDEDDCLAHLLTTKVTLSDGVDRSVLTIGEALALPGLHIQLKSFGVLVEGDYVLIANRHTELTRIYANTRWTNWGQALWRLPGAVKTDKKSFGTRGTLSRTTAIPLLGKPD